MAILEAQFETLTIYFIFLFFLFLFFFGTDCVELVNNRLNSLVSSKAQEAF